MFKKVKTIIYEQMTAGATPEKLAQSVVCGALIGVFPLLGTTTLLAALSATIFKLNHIVTQTVNYLTYPLQILLFPVYIKVVSMIFDVGDTPLRPDLIVKQFTGAPLVFLKQYGLIGFYAVLLWSIISLVAYFILYPIILKIIIKLKNTRPKKWKS